MRRGKVIDLRNRHYRLARRHRARRPVAEISWRPSFNETVDRIMVAALDAAEDAESRLNALYECVGDDDTGTNFAGAVRAPKPTELAT